DGSAAPLHCQGTPEGAESPAPVPPEQSPPGLPPIEASGVEPAGSGATVTPVTSPELTLGAVSWMLPLVWLEKTLNTSFLVESLRHSLPLRKPQQDASSSVTPVPTVVTGTSTTPVPTVVTGTSMTPIMTPVPTMATGTSMTPVLSVATGTFTTPRDVWERSMNTSRGNIPCAKDSAAETDSLLWHCPREQLKTLPRAELEGRLESTLIIIEALSLQLRDWQESQRLRPGAGPAKQRDALTQTDITHPEGVRVLSEAMPPCPPQPRCRDSLSATRGTRVCPLLPVPAAVTPVSLSRPQSTWSSRCPLFRGLADAAFRSLQDEQGALAQEREQTRALVSQSYAMLEHVPGKLRSCLEELAATRERAEE
ncbi:SPAG5 protein, partial [Daphoenositta chrysoptera]|nr:SPAG5 protein [Daphoenositta chrysoptera]